MAKESWSVEDAQRWLAERIEDGAECPCCEQHVQIYRRRIDSAMAFILIKMLAYFSLDEHEPWLHVPKFLERFKGTRHDLRGGDYAKLRFWGFLEQKAEIREDGSARAGYWRITEEGALFASGSKSAPRYAFTYNNTAIRFSSERIDVFRALGEKFDYNEIVGIL